MKNSRFKTIALAVACSVAAMTSSNAIAKHHGEMTKQTIVEKAVATDDFSTLVAAVTAAGLVETLSSEGPFTVFAPLNSAFEKLPAGTVETLVKPENKDTLTTVLTYHVVAGRVKAADLIAMIEKSENGSADIKTVQGGILQASLSGSDVILTDAKGGTSKVVMADVKQSNGIIHAIDTVVMP